MFVVCRQRKIMNGAGRRDVCVELLCVFMGSCITHVIGTFYCLYLWTSYLRQQPFQQHNGLMQTEIKCSRKLENILQYKTKLVCLKISLEKIIHLLQRKRPKTVQQVWCTPTHSETLPVTGLQDLASTPLWFLCRL